MFEKSYFITKQKFKHFNIDSDATRSLPRIRCGEPTDVPHSKDGRHSVKHGVPERLGYGTIQKEVC